MDALLTAECWACVATLILGLVRVSKKKNMGLVEVGA
jgi:hypothetical protein